MKGGNAIDLAYTRDSDDISRTSYDLDYSIEGGDFTENEKEIAKRIEDTLTQTYREHDFILLDYKFLNRPKSVNEDLSEFWGGYKVTFKVIGKKEFDEYNENLEKSRRSAIPLNSNHSNIFELEFSKFEFVQKQPIDVEGFKIYVYTPEMIVFEKVRAICQQLPEYKEVIRSFSPRARARDFYDIHLIMDMYNIDPSTAENIELIRNIFEAKRVPLSFIKGIKTNKTLHEDNWQSVIDTLPPAEELNEFDYYFDFVLTHFENLIFP
ncbi:MAG: nucleotidyl transferase AbiEii/AbiGii toxin family protein [Bacteroidetes bacterium]|nr:nucleotidyl transferase AbiEii/AbiGii toxin family protein [Bacteroidota bacterium]